MIKLLQEHGGYAVGAVIELEGNVEATLISMGKAEKHEGPATNKKIDPDAKPPKEVPVKPMTALESMETLKDHIKALQVVVARGNKGEMDKLGDRLQEVVDWMECLMDDKRHNPSSVANIYEPEKKVKS